MPSASPPARWSCGISTLPEVAPLTLPRVLITDDGTPSPTVDGLTTGTLIHDVDLATMIERVARLGSSVAVDIDTIRGLKADDASVAFVVNDLGVAIIITRRRLLAELAAEMGVIGLLSAQAVDSTGLARSLPSAGGTTRVGTVVTPGLVLPHLSTAELEQISRPIVAHGLIVRPADALACLARAEAVVLRPDAARFLGMRLAAHEHDNAEILTSIRIGE